MATPEALDLPGLPAPMSHYAHAVKAGGFLYISGLLPLDATGALVGDSDPAAQGEAIFATMGTILAAGGLDFGSVVKLTTFLTDIGDRAPLNEIRKRVFGAHKPASTLVEISKLAVPGARIEIEAIALL